LKNPQGTKRADSEAITLTLDHYAGKFGVVKLINGKY
jgi:hypothetical protein